MLKGYLANGLFSLGDRLVNEMVANEVRKAIEVDLYVPQENLSINDKQSFACSLEIYEGDYTNLIQSDFMIAIIDGVEVDSGVASEVGIFSTTGKPIYALYTDTRQQGADNYQKIQALISDATENQFAYRNLFLIGLIKSNGYIFSKIDDLIKTLKENTEWGITL